MARFIEERNIECHSLYYDVDGKFHPERRLGCIGCPMKSDNGKADYKRYPKMLKSLVQAGKKFLETHPECASRKKFGNAYNLVFQDLFCDSYEDYLTKVSTDLWGGQLDTKKFLEDYFGVEL